MCKGEPERPGHRSADRRKFLKATAAVGAWAGALALPSARPAGAQATSVPPETGKPGRRYVIRGGAVLSMDAKIGEFAQADVLIEGKRIVAVGPAVGASGADVIDARGKIVMPGFVDTHHHQFETALRGFLADGLLANDGTEQGAVNYFDYILGRFAKVYRPQDVYINELFGALSQLDAGVTTVLDISQIHHSPEHSDAAIRGIVESGRRTAFGYFEGHGDKTRYPSDAARIRKQYFSSDDQLVSMIMGGEIYLPGYEKAWQIGRELNLPIAAHIVGTLGMGPTFDKLAAAGQFGADNLFIHMTGISDLGWKAAKDAGAGVSIAFPIEMTMRHGMPPILKTLEMGIEPSLSVDVECTMTADFFTQMRAAMTLQRALVNEMAIAGKKDLPRLLTARDVIRFATVQGAKDLKLDRKVGSLTPGKEADIILLDANAINVAPLNHVPGAVVTLMERSNVDSVIVAGKLRKWQGRLLDVDLARLRSELEASRDYLFQAANVQQDLFRR
ncbi:MAG TPA: amidohydrolase family protein [Burkholderiales bacterium]|nr:amidohydrolase family protein [Burkholderiales bacterium]